MNYHFPLLPCYVEGSPVEAPKLFNNRKEEIAVYHNVVCEEGQSLHYAVSSKSGRPDYGAVSGENNYSSIIPSFYLF
jgi:hypothetical protein